MAQTPVPRSTTRVVPIAPGASCEGSGANGVPVPHPLPTPHVLRDRLAATTRELAETATLMQRALVGQDQHTALEVAEAIETAARQLHAMRLLAARAGFPWAPITDLREVHGADAAAGRRSRQAVAERPRNEGA